MSGKGGKILVKCLFVSKYGNCSTRKKATMYDVGIVSADDKYVEYEIPIRQDDLSFWLFRRLYELFQGYRFASDSLVCACETLTERDPFMVYLQIAAQQVGFKVTVVDYGKMFSRIASRIKEAAPVNKDGTLRAMNVPMSALAPLWDGLVRCGRCPWITKACDERFPRSKPVKRRRKQIVRIGALYAVVRMWHRKFEKNRPARPATPKGIRLLLPEQVNAKEVKASLGIASDGKLTVYEEADVKRRLKCVKACGFSYMVFKAGGEFVARAAACPVTDECYALVCRGLVTGKTLKPSMVVDPAPGEFASVYVHDLFVAERYRGSGALLAVLKALSSLAADLQEKGIGIRRVVADPATAEGIKLCEAAGMQNVGCSADGRKIYEAYSPGTGRKTFPFKPGIS